MLLIPSSSVSDDPAVTICSTNQITLTNPQSDEKRVRHIHPKNAYTFRKTMFENYDGNKNQKLFSNEAVFVFESIWVPTGELKATKKTTWIGKHVPISVSTFSNLQDDPIFLCEKVQKLLIIAFVSSLELLSEKANYK